MLHRRVALATASALGLVSLTSPAFIPTANAAEATCAGETATLTDANAYEEEDGSVAIYGTSGVDVVVVAGDEVEAVYGRGGDDLICQTSGSTLGVVDGPGSDTIYGGSAATTYWTYASEDADHATDGDVDTIHDAGGIDELRVEVEAGGVNFDVPSAHLTGVNLDITWHGTMEQFRSDGDGTVFTGGPLADRFSTTGTGSVVRTGGGADKVGAAKPADVETGDGNDDVSIWASDVPGGSRIVTGAGADRVSVDGAGPDEVDSGDGDDIVWVYKDANADAEVALGAGHDWLYYAGKTTASGGSGNDTFFPRGSSSAGMRADLDGGSGHNRINFRGVSTGVNSYLDQGFSRWGTNIVHTTGIGRSTGSKYADVLAGTAFANQIFGGGGNDRLVGRAGNDILRGDAGRDRAEGGPGNDTCTAETKFSC